MKSKGGYDKRRGCIRNPKGNTTVYEIQRGVQHRLTYNFVYSHAFFFIEAWKKGVAVYEIRRGLTLTPCRISYTAMPFCRLVARYGPLLCNWECWKKSRGCIRNPRGVNFYLVGFRIQPHLFCTNSDFFRVVRSR